jgi:dTDP-4-dehydrorhamnose 3,5-epimerase
MTGMTVTIDGVVVAPRRQIVDERGKVAHMLRADDPEFEAFGEVYFSWVNPGVVKAWHLHREMTLNYTCPVGLVKLALWDDREGSATRGQVMEVFLGPDNHQLVKIPPGVWNGFKGVAVTPSLVCNCATIPHRPDEIVRRDPFDPAIPYDWSLRQG